MHLKQFDHIESKTVLPPVALDCCWIETNFSFRSVTRATDTCGCSTYSNFDLKRDWFSRRYRVRGIRQQHSECAAGRRLRAWGRPWSRAHRNRLLPISALNLPKSGSPTSVGAPQDETEFLHALYGGRNNHM